MNIELTTNSYIFQSAKRLLQKELDKCFKLLKDNEEKWNCYMDLKLHYASTENVDFEHYDAKITFDNEVQSRWFYTFCDDMLEQFLNDLMTVKGIDFNELKDNIGRTSSFYLGKLHNTGKDKYSCALTEASYEFNITNLEFNEDENGIHFIDNDLSGYEDVEDAVNGMLALVETMYDDLKDKLDEIIYVYDYIKDFKDNQVEYFKDYVKDTWLANL
jgi:hypothetical protein